MRSARLSLSLLLLLGALFAALPSPALAATPIYFPQTGHALGAHFTLAWRERGGLDFFGYPISAEFAEEGRTTQYFERAVLQYFPEHTGTPYTVQGRHLGRELTLGRESETPFRRVPAAPAGRSYFPETGHTLGGDFGRTWATGGGLLVYGYPLSEEFVEVNPADGKPYLTQYFERVRMEYHPEIADPNYQVLLGQFGRRVLKESLGRDPDPQAQPIPGQTYDPVTGHNLDPRFLAYYQGRGGLAQFGRPLTETFTQKLEDGKEYEVQYFERARFEWHPENPEPFNVLLGQFGRQILAATPR